MYIKLHHPSMKHDRIRIWHLVLRHPLIKFDEFYIPLYLLQHKITEAGNI